MTTDNVVWALLTSRRQDSKTRQTGKHHIERIHIGCDPECMDCCLLPYMSIISTCNTPFDTSYWRFSVWSEN
eukprot:scaffold56169_cov19-Prasinocladus_malaysianus.AAC.1